jgi:hypothetical protein
MAPLLYRLKDHVGINSSGYDRTKEYEEKRQSDDPRLEYATNERDL